MRRARQCLGEVCMVAFLLSCDDLVHRAGLVWLDASFLCAGSDGWLAWLDCSLDWDVCLLRCVWFGLVRLGEASWSANVMFVDWFID